MGLRLKRATEKKSAQQKKKENKKEKNPARLLAAATTTNPYEMTKTGVSPELDSRTSLAQNSTVL